MRFKLILGAVLLLAALFFSVQNADVVDVRFLAWKFSTSLAFLSVERGTAIPEWAKRRGSTVH
jgi:uncharacterized integral membrane protein